MGTHAIGSASNTTSPSLISFLEKKLSPYLERPTRRKVGCESITLGKCPKLPTEVDLRVMADRWSAGQDRAARKYEEARAAIDERQRLMNTGQDSTKMNSQARKLLNELSLLISNLEDMLGEGEGLPQKEQTRREDLLATFKKRRDELQNQFSRVQRVESDARGQLMGPGGGRQSRETSATQSMGDGALMQQQQHIMREQDQGLEMLQQSIARQRQIGLQIGEELDTHNIMLDDLSAGIDNTGARLNRETKHIIHISEKAKTNGMCCCIVLLILVIILVGAIPF
eukprot:m.227583 g.227583  ORF g.227583 m.227583 type:complete len:284 (-) comp17252_c0_seq1:27-878(-)